MLKRLLKVLGWTLGAVIVCYGAAWTVLTAMAGGAERRCDAAWVAAGYPPVDELTRQWPGVGDNPAALELEKLGAAAGFALAPAKAGRNEPTPESAKALEAIQTVTGPDGKPLALKDWFDWQVGGLPGEPAFPAPIAAWLDANRAPLDAIVKHLNASEPAWGYQLRYDAPLIRLADCMKLNRLLVARAIRARQAGDAGQAESTLAAAWRLGDAVGRIPLLIHAQVRVAMRRPQLALLRSLPAPGPEWAARVAAEREAAYRKDVWSVEGRLITLFARRLTMKDSNLAELGVGGALNRRLILPLAIPYTRYGSAEASRIMAGALPSGGVLAGEAGSPPSGPERRVGWLARPFAEIAIPDYRKAGERFDRCRFEAEMTSQVLALRAARASTGRWPATLPAGGSSIVTGGHWNWSAEDGGALSFSNPPKWSDSIPGMAVEPSWHPER